MVLAERNPEMLRNGRRSGGPSPNGYGGAADTTSDDDSSVKKNGSKSKSKQSEYEEKIRVGRDYQAVCPKLVPKPHRKLETLKDRALLVWSPTQRIPEDKMEEYISTAKEKYGYNSEQALGLLFWHKHDLERAVSDLANFTPFPDEWAVEEKVLFEQAFQLHGKSFQRIRQMLPDKSIASLVKYYYSWKKTSYRQSVLDHQEKERAKKNSGNMTENDESDTEDKDKWLVHSENPNLNLDSDCSNIKKINLSASIKLEAQQQQSNSAFSLASNSNLSSSSTPFSCAGCGALCNIVNNTPFGKLCTSCCYHWRRTGAKRSTIGPCLGKKFPGRKSEGHTRKQPRGIHINHDDIAAFAVSTKNQDELLHNTNREIVNLLTQIQQNKQSITALKRKHPVDSEDVRPPPLNLINSRWTNEELLLGVSGIRKFGKDFKKIAETIGTKSEAHVRMFFVNYRRRYNLDNILKEHETMKDKKFQDVNEQQQEGKDNLNYNGNTTELSLYNGQTQVTNKPADEAIAQQTLKKPKLSDTIQEIPKASSESRVVILFD